MRWQAGMEERLGILFNKQYIFNLHVLEFTVSHAHTHTRGSHTLMIFLSLLFFALSTLREPTDLTWVGYSGDGACEDMALGTYCTCEYIKVATESRCYVHDDLYNHASCRDGVFNVWKTSYILWTRVVFACFPDEYSNLTQFDPQRPNLQNIIPGNRASNPHTRAGMPQANIA